MDFVSAYRNTLERLGMQPAPDDPECIKAFDCANVGEVLGIRFDTVEFTWALPHDKLYRLLTTLKNFTEDASEVSVRDMESALGKLNYISQLCPPIRNFTADLTFMLRNHLQDMQGEKDRDKRKFKPTEAVKQDLRMVIALMADTMAYPLPIVDPDPAPPLCATNIYPDASGHIGGEVSPALGMLFPPQNLHHAVAFSIPFPTDFLLSPNGTGLVADTTTTLESLGVLTPMLIAPDLCVGKSLHFRVDNMAAVFGYHKRRCNDRLAHTVIRASYLVAGALGCVLFVSWTPRRSCQFSVIAAI